MIHNLSREQYQGLAGWNQSTLKKWIEHRTLPGEFKFWWDHRNDPDTSPARLLGRGLDCILLEPDTFKDRFAVAPQCDRRTKAGKEIWKAFVAGADGKEILTSEQRGKISAMQIALMAESSLFHVFDICRKACLQGELWGFTCKAELDLWDEGKTEHIWDVKALDDVSPEGFAKAFFKWGYNHQATFYLGLANLHWRKTVFNFICVKNDAPFTVKVHSFAPDQDDSHRMVADWTRDDLIGAMAELEERFNGKGFANDPDWSLIRIPRREIMRGAWKDYGA